MQLNVIFLNFNYLDEPFKKYILKSHGKNNFSQIKKRFLL